MFARNLLAAKLDPAKAFEMTFGSGASGINARQEGIKSLENPIVQNELMTLLPSDHDTADIINEAFRAPTPAEISWGDKHKFIETVMKAKKQLGSTSSDAGAGVQVGIVIEQ